MQHATRLDEIKRLLREAAIGSRRVELDIDRAVFGLKKEPEDFLGILVENPGIFVSPDQTSYFSIMRVVEEANIESGKTFIDLGSGVGRVVISVAILTGAKAIGVEIVAGRYEIACEAARRLRVKNAIFVNRNFFDVDIIDADYIFMFNPIYKHQSSVVEEKISTLSSKRNIIIVSSDDVAEQVNIDCYAKLTKRIRPTSHSNGIGFRIFESYSR